MKAEVTAAVVVIGNEVLSGRTADVNLNYIARKLAERGIVVRMGLVIPDDPSVIARVVREAAQAHTYVFTTGGIGPTHDDITTESIADGLGLPTELDQGAVRLLADHYGGMEQLNPARLKMATVPRGARLIRNPVSMAPGYQIQNIFVLAGIPVIMQAMLEDVLPHLMSGLPIYTETVFCQVAESLIAEELAQIQSQFKTVEIGSYPAFKLEGPHDLHLVLKSTDKGQLRAALLEVQRLVQARFPNDPSAW